MEKQDPCYDVRWKVLRGLFEGSLSLALSRRFVALMVNFACDPDKSITKMLKDSFSNCIKKRREFIEQRKDNPAAQGAIPELLIPYVLFFLAHQFDFQSEAPTYTCSIKFSPSLSLSPSLPPPSLTAPLFPFCFRKLQFLISQLKTASNGAYLFNFFDKLRRISDALDPSFSEVLFICICTLHFCFFAHFKTYSTISLYIYRESIFYAMLEN